jgi:lysophospholipase L1-like esterase
VFGGIFHHSKTKANGIMILAFRFIERPLAHGRPGKKTKLVSAKLYLRGNFMKMNLNRAFRSLGLALFVAFLALAAAAPLSAQSQFYLKPGDRVVFYGDSITDQRLYTSFVETYTVTRFPRLNVSFVHSGWGGDRVSGGGGGPIDTRLKRDVIAFKPTVVTIMLGMNDGGYRAYDEGLYNAYVQGYEHIIKTLRTALPNVRITVIEPSPYDDVTRPPQFAGGYNGVLTRYGQFVKQMAQRLNLDVADMNAPVVAALLKMQAENPGLARMVIPDRVHPGAAGHLLMAEALLKAWKAPALVAGVEIDAKNNKVLHQDNTRVTDLKAGKILEWREDDAALPMPVDLSDKLQQLAIHNSDFASALDEEPLVVKGLSPGKYKLNIDGETVGIFADSELGQGLNLAMLETPMMKQALAVHTLTVEHNNIHQARWRSVQVPLVEQDIPEMYKALNALDKLESKLVELQRKAAQPKIHHYELIAQ